MKIQIKHKTVGAHVLFECDVPSSVPARKRIRFAVELAVKKKINLAGAELSFADLRDANLVGGKFVGAFLYGAILVGADCTDCDFRGATLIHADFGGQIHPGARFQN